MNEINVKIAVKVSVGTIIINSVLTGLKLCAGLFAGSYAMLSDAAHTASDTFSTLIVMAGVKISGKKADAGHPYGHERFECIAAVILSVLLFATGAGIGYSGISKLLDGGPSSPPGILALIAAAVSVAVKEGMYRYTLSAAKKIKSGALKADAWHHRSDALSSVGSFAGILGAVLGFAPLDAIAGAVLSAFVIKVAVGIFIDAVRKMTDEACSPEYEGRIRERILSRPNIIKIDSLKTRKFGERVYVDIEIGIDENLTFIKAHDAATNVHDDLEASFPEIKHCTIHANPFNPKDANSEKSDFSE
ncbi:MAG: cation diffusion facilitator family transporter [Clostridiales bacterium]|jgi:cation diffusion facilitator family transporter|nr:cation diffusion facilitator family transporter [Clostridiales bacterium]